MAYVGIELLPAEYLSDVRYFAEKIDTVQRRLREMGPEGDNRERARLRQALGRYNRVLQDILNHPFTGEVGEYRVRVYVERIGPQV